MTETGHVLFLDLVGYSLWSLEEQATCVAELLAHVRATAAFQSAEQTGELIRIGTGDGVALVFLRYPEAPAHCASELRARTGLPLRMGIHIGPVTRGYDINGTVSVTGGGINLAKRVMDLAEVGEVLLTEGAALLLQEHTRWRERLYFWGERETKHQERLRIWTLDPPAPSLVVPKGAAGGGLPLDSERYVIRAADRDFARALARREAIVRLKGPRQVGKTSLLARGLQGARAEGCRVVVADFQALGSDVLTSTDTLYRGLAESLAEQLELVELPDAHWNPSRAGAANLERYLRRVVFAPQPTPLVWAWDEVDRLFPLPFGSEVFGLLRSWHNRRSLDPAGPWQYLTVALAYATEAHLFITDPNQSPFNVGVQLSLNDFTTDELAALAKRCGVHDETATLHAWLGGQPYLCRCALDLLAAGQAPNAALFTDHLERLLFSVTQDPALVEALKQVLAGKPCPLEPFFRLRSAGILAGESSATAHLRCALYESYLRQQLIR